MLCGSRERFKYLPLCKCFMVKGQPVLATFWRRFFAYIFDSVFLTFLLLAPLLHPFEEGFSEASLSETFSTAFDSHYIFFTLVIAFFVLVYWSVLECWLGQTLGKMIFGISVEGTKKKPLSYLQTVIRNITKVSIVLLFFDTLYMLAKKNNRRFFEVLSDTQVVQEVGNE
ncbi:RDD family protein [Candidatus Woesearchaeota archaeon]|nr:RDD family protein [Candidatus Woesearchaeota archaeon]